MAEIKTPKKYDVLQKGLSAVAGALDPNEKIRQAIDACIAKGGQWDGVNNKCVFPQSNKTSDNQKPVTEDIQKPGVTTPEVFMDPKTGRPSGIDLPGGKTFLGLNPDEVEAIADKETSRGKIPEGTLPVGTQAAQFRSAVEGQALQGQVGQFDQLGINPTGLDFKEAATQGIVGSIPRALSLAATGAGIGLVEGGLVGSIVPGAGTAAGAGAGAAIGAVSGFVAGISSSMISNFKSQRKDTINAQKRVLDEGKQTMKDWATLAEADPVNKQIYLSEYNKVAAQIDQAYRQMILDTNKDVAKFETALPDLAEFEAFYAAGGEKDTLDQEMRNSLLVPGSPEYKMLELANRRNVK